MAAIFLLASTATMAERYPNKPDCEALKEPGASFVCMEKYADCSTPGWLSPPDRAACLAEERAMQGGLEDHRRRRLLSVLSNREQAKLKMADAAYDKYVSAQCAFEAERVSGGSMHAGEVNSCVLRLKDLRTQDYVRMEQNAKIGR